MVTQEDIFGLINASRQIRRAPMIRVEFLHQRPVSPDDRFARRTFLKSKHLISQIFGHRAAVPVVIPPPPRVGVTLICMTPAGKPAVQIRFK